MMMVIYGIAKRLINNFVAEYEMTYIGMDGSTGKTWLSGMINSINKEL